MMVLNSIRKLFDIIIILLFSWMAFAVIAQVIGRYVFNFSIAWATETATFAQIWMVLIGAGYAMRHELHVGVDMLPMLLPPPAKRVLALLITLAALWFLWVVFQGSLRLLKIGIHQRSPALQIQMFYPYLALPVGTAYFAFELIVSQWAKIFPGNQTTNPVEE